MRKWTVIVAVLLILAGLLAACGAKGGAASVPMETYDGSAFSMSYPKAWNTSNTDIMGISMVMFSTRTLTAADLQGLDFQELVATDPIALVMVVPAEFASQMGLTDLDAALSQANEVGSAEDVKVIQQGDTTIGGAPGKLMIAQGNVPDVGQAGVHIVAAKRDDGSVVMFVGYTPETSLDQNLAVFEQMQKSFKFK